MKVLQRIIPFVGFMVAPLAAFANGDDPESHAEESSSVAAIDPMVLGFVAGGIVLVGALAWFFFFRKKQEATGEYHK